jgi:hypothetical protein
MPLVVCSELVPNPAAPFMRSKRRGPFRLTLLLVLSGVCVLRADSFQPGLLHALSSNLYHRLDLFLSPL